MDSLKKFNIVTSDVPTTEELEMLKDARERVWLVIRARWAVLAIFALYSIVVFILFKHSSADISNVTTIHRAAAALAFFTAVAYNAWFHYSFDWFAGIRSLNAIQLLFDLMFVTLIVHFSGGAVSWFWTMYMVLTLEAAMIMDRPSDTYAMAMAGSIAYGGLLTLEYYGLITPVQMPFENNKLQNVFSYEMMKWSWVTITNFCVSFVGVFLMDTIRRREILLRDLAVRDTLTTLYNRRYFFYRLNSEIQRSKRYGRPLSLLVLDVDNFKNYNDRFGHPAGDRLLRSIAETLTGNIRRSDVKPIYEVDIACRYGGEEFAVILPEAASVQGAAMAEKIRSTIQLKGAVVVAERIRRQIESAHYEADPGVTVSIGISSYPDHGTDVETLVKAADDAMYEAKRSGKNRVVVAGISPLS